MLFEASDGFSLRAQATEFMDGGGADLVVWTRSFSRAVRYWRKIEFRLALATVINRDRSFFLSHAILRSASRLVA